MKRLTPAVSALFTMGSLYNSYFIDGPDGSLTLVDTGSGPTFIDKVEQALQSVGKSWADVRRILITHEHYDHHGGLAEAQRRVNAVTYAHRLGAPIIRGEKIADMPAPDHLRGLNRFLATRVKPPAVEPARVDRELSDDEVLDEIAPGAQVVHLPGHAYGQIGLWLPEERTLIGGDVMMNLPWGLSVPIKFVSPDWQAVHASIRRVAGLQAKTLCLGHGPALVGDAAARIERFAARLPA